MKKTQEHGPENFLAELADAVVDASRVRPGESVGPSVPNTTGGTLIRPGGRSCYPSFWIRDYAMSLDCGVIAQEEQRHALLLTASRQQERDETLPSGSLIPSGSIADHINFDGTPIFFPGTYNPRDQGGPWGKLPALDDHFYFVHMAWEYVRQTGNRALLRQMVDGQSLMQRLERAFAVPPADDETGLVVCTDSNRGVNFGFYDTVIHTGALLFCSLLRWQAARELRELTGQSAYADTAARIQAHLTEIFRHPGGLLRASTGRSSQPDVWGSAYAVVIGALDGASARSVAERLAAAYRAGTLAWRGNIRHVLTCDDHSATTAWDTTDCPLNRYQNGAYWNTPTGWVCEAMAKVDEPAARKLAAEYLDELREGDFRQGDDFGSPYECLHPDGHRRNPVYMTSVTCPLASFHRLGWV